MNSPIELRIPLETGGTPDAAAAPGVPRAGTTALVYPAGGNERRGSSAPAIGASFVLAHGAGADQRSTFVVEFARGLAALGLDVVTFDFLYMALGRRMPDRGPALEACYRRVIATVRGEVDSARRNLFIGGKSMGGRIATQVAAGDRDLPVAGLVLIGYPLHPPNRPSVLRAAHLPAVCRPMLFVQGSRDGFGTPSEIGAVCAGLSPAPTMYVVEGGDHSLTVSRRDPAAQAAIYANVQRAIVQWVTSIVAR